MTHKRCPMNTKKQAWYGTGVGHLANDLIKAGLTDQEVLERVLNEYKDAGTKISSIRWYRSKMRSEDSSIPTNQQALRNKRSLQEGWSDTMNEGTATEISHIYSPTKK